VLLALSYPTGQADVYLKEAVEWAISDQFMFCDSTKSDTMFKQLGWDRFEGMYGTALGSLKVTAGTAFDNAYEAEYGEEPPLPFMRETYDAVYVIALAVEKAGSTESRDIRDAIRDIANSPGKPVNPGVEGFAEAKELIAAGEAIDYEGATGVIEFDDKGDVLQGAIEVWEVQAGAIVEAVHTFFVDLSTSVPTIIEVTQ
jgi:ABC-type branched-subunit amino acid transport system substrate-binding protein